MKKRILFRFCHLVVALCMVVTVANAQTNIAGTLMANATFDSLPGVTITSTDNVITSDDGSTVREVPGWSSSSSGWAAGGTFEYGTSGNLNSEPVPSVASDGATAGSGHAALGISVAWGGEVIYSQRVTLRAGKYIMAYQAYNAFTQTAGVSLVGWVPDTGDPERSMISAFPVQTWISDTIAFTLFEETSGEIQLGVRSPGSGSGSNARVFMDGLAIIKVGEVAIDDARLSDLTLSVGKLVPDFHPDTFSYTVELPKGRTAVNIQATPRIGATSLDGDGDQGLTAGGGTLAVAVTALDEVTTATYTIDYRFEAISSDASLQSIGLSFGELVPAFDPAIYAYQVIYPVDSSAIRIAAVPAYAGAAVRGDGLIALGDGETEATITVTAENGTTRNYIISLQTVYLAPGTGMLAPDGVWSWFQDPRAVYYEGEKKQTYTGWITSEGDVQVASFNHETGEIVQHTIKADFQVDDHNNPTFLVREDGRIMASYSGHFFGPMRVVVSQNPEDVTSWGPEATFGTSVTYANPYQVGDSTVMFYRDGSTWHPTIAVSMDGGVSWGDPLELITRDGSQKRPYVKYTQDSEGAVHMIFTDGHPRQEAANKVYYVKFKDSKFYRADGSLIKAYTGSSTALDIDKGEPEVIYDASGGKGWTWDIALDEQENPVVLYAAFPDDRNHHYYYAYWDGSRWVNHFIVNSGGWFPLTPEGKGEPEPNYSGGMSLDPENTSVVYLSKEVHGVFEIFKYTTGDKGLTWTTKQLTKNTPEGIVNIRPVVPRNHRPGQMEMLWLRGEYVFYLNDYHTAVMYYNPSEAARLYDFGTSDSPLDAEAFRVTPETLFDGDFGFTNVSGLQEGVALTGSDLAVDFVRGAEPAAFKVKLMNGTYKVSVMLGNTEEAFSDLSLSVNGEAQVSGLNIAANEIRLSEFEVRVTTGELVLGIAGSGAESSAWNLNSLWIETISFSANNVDIQEDTVRLYEKNRVRLNYRVNPASLGAVALEWSAQDETIASVTDGMIKALRPGQTYVYGAYEDGLIDSCLVIVDKVAYLTGNLYFDFGPETSLVAQGAIGVFPGTENAGSYGWLDTGGIDARDRGSSASMPQGDFVFSSNTREFQVYMPNGQYSVETYHGDISNLHDDFAIYANNSLKVSGITTASGEFVTAAFDVTVTEGLLRLKIQDDGGADANWVWNSLKIAVPDGALELDSMYVNGAFLSDFDPLVVEYALALPVGSAVPIIRAVPRSQTAVVHVSYPADVPGTISVDVVQGDRSHRYELRLEELPRKDATLNALSVDGVGLDGFHPDTLVYDLKLPAGTTKWPEIIGLTNDSTAQVTVTEKTTPNDHVAVVVLAQDGQTTITYVINISIEGTALANRHQSQILIFPNPATDALSFKSLNDTTKLEIRDVQGRLVLSHRLKPQQGQRLDISHLEAGVYMISIQDQQRRVSHKLVIKP